MIETTITKIQYDADGVQRRWSIPFPYADVKHISIYTKVGEEPTVKVVDNYDIDEADSVVIYPTVASGQEPIAAGTKITIARETPETQLEDASQVHFTSKDVERGLDKLTMITQELSTTAGETMEVSAAAFEAAEEAVNTANQLADKEFVTTITDELAADITALNADIQQINLIKWVQALPATGETKYLYAIPRNEVDKDGKKIVALYLWDGTEWRGAGGTSIDPGISEGDGIKGDYCTTYGIIDAPNGILANPSGMEVVLKQGVVLQLAGQDIKTTISGDMAHTITSTADCDLFYVSGTTSLMEVAQIVWSRVEPDNGQAGVLAWWNPDNKKWKFKSNDTGNVWAEAVATPVAHIHTNGTTITRIDHIGYRVLDDEVYALKSETNTALAGKANTDLSNVPANIDYVVDYKNPTDSDPNWYRKYKSGWLEQGGITGKVADYETATITLPLQFLDTHYTVSYANWRAGTTDDGTWNSAAVLNNSTKSTTSFQIYSRGNADGGKIFTWHACGQGA